MKGNGRKPKHQKAPDSKSYQKRVDWINSVMIIMQGIFALATYYAITANMYTYSQLLIGVDLILIGALMLKKKSISKSKSSQTRHLTIINKPRIEDQPIIEKSKTRKVTIINAPLYPFQYGFDPPHSIPYLA